MGDAPFFYVPLHPKQVVLRDIALALLQHAGICASSDASPVNEARLSKNLIWPVYPEIADRLGISGDYIFRPSSVGGEYQNREPMDLGTLVERALPRTGSRRPISQIPR